MFYFVIDTDEYAGNFEREMTAFITGCIGECEVGSELTEELEEDGLSSDFFDCLITQEPDENGCHRPCKIWDTPGYFNNGLGKFYKDGQEEQAKSEYRKSCLEEINNFKNTNPKSVEEHRQRWLSKMDDFTKYPAYNSVAICMTRTPTEEELKVLKARALKWKDYVEKAKENNDYCFLKASNNILGFRLIEEKTTCTEVQSWSV
jgi:hypothetical protein